MKEKSEVFSKLLPIEELYTLYNSLSNTIITSIDLENWNYNTTALNNSLTLLCELGMVRINNDNSSFFRVIQEDMKLSDFSKVVYEKLRLSYPEAFLFIEQADLLYDETEAKFYIMRNSVSLNLSGLLMLLDGLGIIRLKRNNIIILSNRILDSRKKYLNRHKTLDELKIQLVRNEEYGVEAELAAIEYEISLLKNAGIDKVPDRISEYNTNAGYDIVSFMYADSVKPDKYIEVKSCSDDRWIFYISKNELKEAKVKRDSYFLYLFNRRNRFFRVIQNPFEYLFNSDDKDKWVIEPYVYQIKSLERLT